jgi:hypothetical protein
MRPGTPKAVPANFRREPDGAEKQKLHQPKQQDFVDVRFGAGTACLPVSSDMSTKLISELS